MSDTTTDQLRHFLSDLYSLELQDFTQLESAPELAGTPTLADALRSHRRTTERQIERLETRLAAIGGSASAVKDSVMKLGGKGFLLFARVQSETPGRLLVHSYAYEAMARGAYAMLTRLSEIAGDPATTEIARTGLGEEEAVLTRMDHAFAPVEHLAHDGLPEGKLRDHLVRHLAELHALVTQSEKLLDQGASETDDEVLAEAYRDGLERTQLDLTALEQQLKALDSSPSLIKDTAMKLGGMNWSLFFHSQSDTPMKLLVFTAAVEHLVLAAARLLEHTASRAADTPTVELCQKIITARKASAARLLECRDRAIDATLAQTAS
jgi:ferritin-like metal-binding protein YciE